MKRLTLPQGEGMWVLLSHGVTQRKALSRLAAYEDTGLDPEEIKKRLCAGELSYDGEPVQRWISVEDKLPVGSSGKCHCESVVAYTVEGEVCPGWMNGDTWHLLLPRDNAHTKHGRGYVTHWMPMPEPPKEDDQNG